MRTFLLWILLALPAVADELVVVTKAGCPPCRALKRDLLRRPDMYRPHSLFVYEGSAASRWKVDAYPTLILVRDGHEVARHVGYTGPDSLTDWLRRQ